MKPYTKVFLKAVVKSSKQSDVFKNFANGLMGQVPKNVLINYLDQAHEDVKIFVKNVIEYFAKYILRDEGLDPELADEILRKLKEV